MNQLAEIQSEVKAPKSQFNSFGKYKYRSCEDIVEAVKPIINKRGFSLIISDEVVLIGQRFYFKSTAIISNGKETYSAVGWAREEESKKGMDQCQVSGAASSYARKYALNGLFAIDDNSDSDVTNMHGKEEPKEEKKEEPKLKKKFECTPAHAKWNEIHKRILEGSYTIEELEKIAILSDENKALLLKP